MGKSRNCVLNQCKKEKKIGDLGRFLLSELGIAGENGSKDLLSMLEYLYGQEKAQTFEFGFPALKRNFSSYYDKEIRGSSFRGGY